MSDEHEGFRDRIIGGCGDCTAYTEVVTPVGQPTTITTFHDPTCPMTQNSWVVVPDRHTRQEIKPDVLPDWPEQ